MLYVITEGDAQQGDYSIRAVLEGPEKLLPDLLWQDWESSYRAYTGNFPKGITVDCCNQQYQDAVNLYRIKSREFIRLRHEELGLECKDGAVLWTAFIRFLIQKHGCKEVAYHETYVW